MPTVISELTGEPVDTASEAWRHECECSWLLANKPTKGEKHLHLYGVRDREQLFEFSAATGKVELAENWEKRVAQVDGRPALTVLKVRGLAAADRLLEDAKRLWEARQRKEAGA